MTDQVRHVRERLRTQLELEQIGLARAQQVFADTMAEAQARLTGYYNGPQVASRQVGQGMCRPGWTGDMWKWPHRP